MTIPLWVLLAFAAWTLIILTATVGVYRWRRIFTRTAVAADLRAEDPGGPEWYRRGHRAHMNCIENLPLYTAVVVAMTAAGAASPLIDGLAITLMVARICQSLVHVSFEQTPQVAGLRFLFYLVQVVCLAWMGILVALAAGG